MHLPKPLYHVLYIDNLHGQYLLVLVKDLIFLCISDNYLYSEALMQMLHLIIIKVFANIMSTIFTVCWWIGSFMAAIFWHSGSSLFLLSLLLCKWSCSYWCHVYRLLVCCQCSRHSTILWSHGARLLIKPHGWTYPLWHWISSYFLWCQLRSSQQMVGLWIPHICCQHYYLARSWRRLVEVHWLVVKQLVIRIGRTKLQQFLIFGSSLGAIFPFHVTFEAGC